MNQVRHLGAPDFVLGGQAVDVRAGAADPAALDDRHAAAGVRQVPGQELPSRAAAEDEDVILLRHHGPSCVGLGDQRTRNSRIAAAICAACVSRAKCPVSKKRTTAWGMSRLNASAPGGRKNGSFLPQTARNGGLWVRK